VVALLISLKISLLRGALRTSLSQRIGLIIGALFALSCAAGGVVLLIALRVVDAAWASFGVIVGGSVLVLGWAVVPLLVSGVDETLDPARFALLPLSARQLAPGLLITGLIGLPGAATSLLAVATLITWTRGPLPLLLAVPAAALGVLTCVLVSRLLTTAAARLLAARRAREVGTVIMVLLVSSTGIWPAVLSHQDFSAPDAARIADVLAWTPLGLPWAAPADAATGHLARGLIRLALAVAVLALGTLAWSALLGRALCDQRDGGGTRARAGRSVIDRLPATPVWSVAARSLRYWRRDPRYLVAVTGIVISAVVPLVAIGTQSGGRAVLLAAGPYAGMLLGIVTWNDVGYDGSAFATHLLAGIPGQVDRLGRVLAVLCWSVPLVTVLSVGGAVAGGRGGLWPGCLGAALGGLLSGLGAGSVAGALVPYPMPEAGSNPFRGNSGGGARALVAQLALMSITGTAAAPALILLVVSAVSWPPGAVIALVVGPAIGVGVLTAGVRVGGRTLEARGPEILAAVRKPQ
jgi:ABC-2 type transport system permease protein